MFLNSMPFLSCSLEGLVGNLKETDMHQLRRAFPKAEQRSLLTPMGVYPHDYMDSIERFEETLLP